MAGLDIFELPVGTKIKYDSQSVGKRDIFVEDPDIPSTYAAETRKIVGDPEVDYATILAVVPGRYAEIKVTYVGNTGSYADEVEYFLYVPDKEPLHKTEKLRVRDLPNVRRYIAQHSMPAPIAVSLQTPPAAGKRRKKTFKKKMLKKKKTLKRR